VAKCHRPCKEKSKGGTTLARGSSGALGRTKSMTTENFVTCGLTSLGFTVTAIDVGAGKTPRSFRIVDTQMNTTDAVLHVYERRGRP